MKYKLNAVKLLPQMLARLDRTVVLVLSIVGWQHIGRKLALDVAWGVVLGHDVHLAIANRLCHANIHC